MTLYFSERVAKVDVAMAQLCRAYASDRVTKSTFRAQRSALIRWIYQQDELLPELILNEFSQGMGETFAGENTPVLDDLGFSRSVTPVKPVSPTNFLSQIKRASQFRESDTYSAPRTPFLERAWDWFERHYWLMLLGFVIWVCSLIIAP